jgi:hypothetical protein
MPPLVPGRNTELGRPLTSAGSPPELAERPRPPSRAPLKPGPYLPLYGVSVAFLALERRPIVSTATSSLSLEDFGARAGCTWRETDEAETDLETVLQGLLSGQYAYQVRIVRFNAIEGWSHDATSDVADGLARPAVDTDDDISAALQAFIAHQRHQAL